MVLAGGAGGALHLCLLVHRLRAVRRWFALELKVMGLFGLMGVATAIIGVVISFLDNLENRLPLGRQLRLRLVLLIWVSHDGFRLILN